MRAELEHRPVFVAVGLTGVLVPVRHPPDPPVLVVRLPLVLVVLLRPLSWRALRLPLDSMRQPGLEPRLEGEPLLVVAGQLLRPLVPLAFVHQLPL